MNREKERQRIGLRIAELRAEKKLTQRQLAGKTGLQQCHVSRIELGRYSVGVDTLATIAEALGCRMDFVSGDN